MRRLALTMAGVLVAAVAAKAALELPELAEVAIVLAQAFLLMGGLLWIGRRRFKVGHRVASAGGSV